MPDNKGYALGLIFAGSIFTYAGIKGLSITSAITAIIQGKSPSTATPFGQFNVIAAATTGGAAGAAGGSIPSAAGATSGSEIANGTTIYKYLRGAGYNPMQAAGAIASIWGESTWNPSSQGTGGRGLIGWTPPSTISNADFSGGMATQLPAILRFVSQNGDQGVVNQMASASSITQSALLWGHGVERFGISDVHPQGVALAAQIAKSVDNVSLAQ